MKVKMRKKKIQTQWVANILKLLFNVINMNIYNNIAIIYVYYRQLWQETLNCYSLTWNLTISVVIVSTNFRKEK